MSKSYLEMLEFKTYEERFEYLRLNGKIAEDTFGYSRYLNQALYSSPEWKIVRRKVILRDRGCDLAIEDRPINSRIYIHHINPITQEQILDRDPLIFDLNNLITVTYDTHQAIHYGNVERTKRDVVTVRKPGDTCEWLKK